MTDHLTPDPARQEPARPRKGLRKTCLSCPARALPGTNLCTTHLRQLRIAQFQVLAQLSPDEAERAAVVAEAIYGPLPKRRGPKRIPSNAYIAALKAAYFALQPDRARQGRRPSHTECARIAGLHPREKPLTTAASIKRLKRASPPTSWEQLVSQWEEMIENR